MVTYIKADSRAEVSMDGNFLRKRFKTRGEEVKDFLLKEEDGIWANSSLLKKSSDTK